MKLLGVVRTVAHNGALIVKAKYAPELGQKILDARNKKIGKVSRVFGPVKEPYVSFMPFKSEVKNMLELISREVYSE